MRKSKPRTSTSHQLCELAGSLVTDIPLTQSLEVSREGEQVNGGSHLIFLPELQVQSQMGQCFLLFEPMKAETCLPTVTYQVAWVGELVLVTPTPSQVPRCPSLFVHFSTLHQRD